MGHAHKFIKLSEEEDRRLLELETSDLVSKKVRLRASIIRLSNKGMNTLELSQHFNRSIERVRKDLDRYIQVGIEGLSDGKSSGRPSKFTAEIEEFISAKLNEDQVWNSDLLVQAIEEEFSVEIKREAMRTKLQSLGYRWKRSRYSPGQSPDPDEVASSKAALESLKRGHWTINSP